MEGTKRRTKRGHGWTHKKGGKRSRPEGTDPVHDQASLQTDDPNDVPPVQFQDRSSGGDRYIIHMLSLGEKDPSGLTLVRYFTTDEGKTLGSVWLGEEHYPLDAEFSPDEWRMIHRRFNALRKRPLTTEHTKHSLFPDQPGRPTWSNAKVVKTTMVRASGARIIIWIKFWDPTNPMRIFRLPPWAAASRVIM